jgi:hypothetical protein
MNRKFVALGAVVVGAVALLFASSRQGVIGAEGAKDPVLERTRREVRLLDDIYKTAVVLITKHYVNESSDLSAGQAAKALFAGIKEKGWHEARLVDATGDPLVKSNAPQDGFEKEAVKRLKANEPYYDQVIEEDGKKFLRAATPVPVVMEKCVMCHENYRNNKGIIGILHYKLPLVQ